MTQPTTVLVGMSLHPDAATQLAAMVEIKPLAREPSQLVADLATADGVLTYSPSFDPPLLGQAARLKIIACHACPAPMQQAALAQNVRVTLVPSLWDTVADHTLALMFAAARLVPQADAAIRRGQWDTTDLKVRFSGRDIFGTTLGIIGLGKIGTAVARRVQGFAMRICYADTVRKVALEQALQLEHTDLDTLLAQADIVVVAVPLNVQTRGMLGPRELGRLKADAILVNTARGAIIDEQALFETLRAGRIAGAGLDVFVEEPLGPGHPLLTLDNVVLTPHLGGSTKECDLVLVEDVLRVLRGQEPLYPA